MSEATKHFNYNGLSHFQPSPQMLCLFTDASRPIKAQLRIKKEAIGAVREALNALMLVLSPGFDYRPSATATGKINYDQRADNLAQARDYFCATIRKTDPASSLGMDPTISLSEKGLLIEGLSKNGQDMGSIFVPASSYETVGDVVLGSSTMEAGPDLLDGLLHVSTKDSLSLAIGSDLTSTEKTEKFFGAVDKSFRHPNDWKREILQFLAASGLENNAKARFNRIDLYNVLRHLRLNKPDKADKTASKALRFVLINGVNPEIHLEPWGVKITSPIGRYRGQRSACLEFYDRDKLVRLEPLLPYITHVDVHIMGEALPAFWILNSDVVSYTYATLGYKTSNWARGLLRDQILRRDTENPTGYVPVIEALQTARHADVDQLSASTGLPSSVVQAALVRGIQLGVVAPNAGVGGFQHREIFVGTKMDALRYGSARASGYKDETRAYQIVDQGRVNMNGRITVRPNGEVDFARLNQRFAKVADKVEVKFTTDPVIVTQQKLDFQKEDPVFYPKLQLNVRGATRKPGCTCAYMDAMKDSKDPICSHLQALWIQYCRDHILGESTGVKSLAQNILLQVTESGEKKAHRLSIRARRVIDEWGSLDDLNGGKPERRVRLFQRQQDAYQAFLSRISELESQGFINAG